MDLFGERCPFAHIRGAETGTAGLLCAQLGRSALWRGASTVASSGMRVLDAPLRMQELGVAIVGLTEAEAYDSAATAVVLDMLTHDDGAGAGTGARTGPVVWLSRVAAVAREFEPAGIALRRSASGASVDVSVEGVSLGRCQVVRLAHPRQKDGAGVSATIPGAMSTGHMGGMSSRTPRKRTPSKRQRAMDEEVRTARALGASESNGGEGDDERYKFCAVLVQKGAPVEQADSAMDVVCVLDLAWGCGGATGDVVMVMDVKQEAGLLHVAVSASGGVAANGFTDIPKVVTAAIMSPFRSPHSTRSDPVGSDSIPHQDNYGSIEDDAVAVGWQLRLLSLVLAMMLSVIVVVAARHGELASVLSRSPQSLSSYFARSSVLTSPTTPTPPSVPQSPPAVKQPAALPIPPVVPVPQEAASPRNGEDVKASPRTRLARASQALSRLLPVPRRDEL